MDNSFERRLDQLREQAQAHGFVAAPGVRPAGSPLPTRTEASEKLAQPGYYGLPVIKPPVWEWMIGAYLFVGGLAGMSGLVAMASLLKRQWAMARVGMWSATVGALVSTVLLTWDLGRPRRFLHMLRVFKLQSPMSLGSWILTLFGACSVIGLALTEWQWRLLQSGISRPTLQLWTDILITGSGITGVFLATYTGALVAVTAVPAWHIHRLLLPFHFGMAGLGSASALLELAGFRQPSLEAIGFFAASAETLVMLWLEVRKHGAADRVLHEGKSGWALRIGGALAGPLALAFRGIDLTAVAAAMFLLGALVTRFGWLWAGTASACDPESVYASQRGNSLDEGQPAAAPNAVASARSSGLFGKA